MIKIDLDSYADAETALIRAESLCKVLSEALGSGDGLRYAITVDSIQAFIEDAQRTLRDGCGD